MVRVVHEEQSETIMDSINLPVASDRGLVSNSHSVKHGEVTVGCTEGSLYRYVALCFGLLCILQAGLNISMRLALYTEDRKADSDDILKNLTRERDELKRKLVNFTEYYQQGWVYFNNSFYFISKWENSWQDSRNDCLQRGTDLVIINSKEEQEFVNQVKKQMWIGLTDRETEGTWKWVDGSPVITSYWGYNEPNSHQGTDEDCGEIKLMNQENKWNDKPCESKNHWICEKKIGSLT
ncbi:hypothetical protein PAMP_020792 [Pampus punctatissimus]